MTNHLCLGITDTQKYWPSALLVQANLITSPSYTPKGNLCAKVHKDTTGTFEIGDTYGLIRETNFPQPRRWLIWNDVLNTSNIAQEIHSSILEASRLINIDEFDAICQEHHYLSTHISGVKELNKLLPELRAQCTSEQLNALHTINFKTTGDLNMSESLSLIKTLNMDKEEFFEAHPKPWSIDHHGKVTDKVGRKVNTEGIFAKQALIQLLGGEEALIILQPTDEATPSNG